MMELWEIVSEWLKNNNYNGLFIPNECACELGELMPCGNPRLECRAGIKKICKSCDKIDSCDIRDEWGAEWCITIKLKENDAPPSK